MTFQPQPHARTANATTARTLAWILFWVKRSRAFAATRFPLAACRLLIIARVQSPSKLKTTLARLLTTGIIVGAGLAVCHMLFFFLRNGRHKARHT